MSKKATDNRTFTVNGGRILQLPILSMYDLKIASSTEAEEFVKELIHDERNNGIPTMHFYNDHGVVLQPLNPTTSHVLLVVDAVKALDMMAILHHTYSLLGYTLVYDETTVLLTLPSSDEQNDSGKSSLNTPSKDANESETLASVPSRQSKLDVLGMEVA